MWRWWRFWGFGKQEGIYVWDGALSGSAICHLLDDCKTERWNKQRRVEDIQGHLVHLMPLGRITFPRTAEPIKGLVMRLLAAQRQVRRSFKDLGCELTNHSFSTCFSVRQAPIFPCLPHHFLLWHSSCSLAVPAEGRQRKGEETYVVAADRESSEHVKANFLNY